MIRITLLCTSRKLGDSGPYVSACITEALAVEAESDCVWFWIGSHAEYDKLLNSK